MNHDEFSFFNHQLSSMLRDGIPLEGAIKQLCAGMRSNALRQELERLEADLRQGTPLKEALRPRELPEFFKIMVGIGVRANDLPGTLTLLADYYQNVNALWIRLKALLVYPAIVIIASICLTLFVSLIFNRSLNDLFNMVDQPQRISLIGIWAPSICLCILGVVAMFTLLNPVMRARLRWKIPAFREASLAHLASAISLMLRNGTTLAEALALAQTMETNTAAGRALDVWRQQVEFGNGKPASWPRANPFPPLFLWLVQQSREDVAAGFQKAANIYQARASYRIELALYAALPLSLLILGLFIFWQIMPIFATFIRLINWLTI